MSLATVTRTTVVDEVGPLGTRVLDGQVMPTDLDATTRRAGA